MPTWIALSSHGAQLITRRFSMLHHFHKYYEVLFYSTFLVRRRENLKNIQFTHPYGAQKCFSRSAAVEFRKLCRMRDKKVDRADISFSNHCRTALLGKRYVNSVCCADHGRMDALFLIKHIPCDASCSAGLEIAH